MELVIANRNYSSWSLRPWVMMRMLGIAFSERLIPFPGGDSRPTYLPFSPSGRVPCLIDGEAKVWDSLAIVEYLAEAHPRVWPADKLARAWARSASAEMHSSFFSLRNICGMNCGIRVELFEKPESLTRDIERLVALWGQGLSTFGGPFLAGPDFTAVDAFFCPVAFRARTYALDFGAEGDAYLARLRDLAPMRAWYEAALAETFRDEEHDEEARRVGRIVEDLRRLAAI